MVEATAMHHGGADNQMYREQLLERRHRLEAATASDDSAVLADLIQQVDAALHRLEDGSFGSCQVCHGTVEAGRLMADPLARVCLECLTPQEQRALEHDLTLAADIQGALLPERDLRFGGWEIHYQYKPLGSVSGDYCDLIADRSTPDGLFFVLGDVSGKGVSAAILMAHLQAIFRGLVAAMLPLEEIMVQANRLFCQGTLASSFSTLVFGRMDVSGKLELCNAGHCPPLLVRQGEVIELPAKGLPVGMFDVCCYCVERHHLEHGDTLFLYTDGLSESADRDDREFGVSELCSILSAGHDLPVRQIAGQALDAAAAFRSGVAQQDDLTVMVVRRLG